MLAAARHRIPEQCIHSAAANFISGSCWLWRAVSKGHTARKKMNTSGNRALRLLPKKWSPVSVPYGVGGKHVLCQRP